MPHNLDHNYGAASTSTTQIPNNNFYLPNKKITTMPYIIEAGQTLLAGSVLGKVTATNELKLFDAASGDGSEKAFAILLHDVDTTTASTSTAVAVEGYFDEEKLIYGGASTADDARWDLKAQNIYLEIPRLIA